MGVWGLFWQRSGKRATPVGRLWEQHRWKARAEVTVFFNTSRSLNPSRQNDLFRLEFKRIAWKTVCEAVNTQECETHGFFYFALKKNPSELKNHIVSSDCSHINRKIWGKHKSWLRKDKWLYFASGISYVVIFFICVAAYFYFSRYFRTWFTL